MNKGGLIEGIVPQRFLPFDIGIAIDQGAKKKIENYFLTNEYEVKPISGLLKSISADAILIILDELNEISSFINNLQSVLEQALTKTCIALFL